MVAFCEKRIFPNRDLFDFLIRRGVILIGGHNQWGSGHPVSEPWGRIEQACFVFYKTYYDVRDHCMLWDYSEGLANTSEKGILIFNGAICIQVLYHAASCCGALQFLIHVMENSVKTNTFIRIENMCWCKQLNYLNLFCWSYNCVLTQ